MPLCPTLSFCPHEYACIFNHMARFEGIFPQPYKTFQLELITNCTMDWKMKESVDTAMSIETKALKNCTKV